MASKFLLVAQREYLTRVRKKAFIILTLAVPLLLAAFGFIIAKVASSDNDTTDVVEVRDDSGLNIAGHLVNTPQLRFDAGHGHAGRGQKGLPESQARWPAGTCLPASTWRTPRGVQFFGKGNISLKKQVAVENALNKAFSELKMQKSGLSQEQLDRLRSKVELQTISLDETGKEADSNALATSGMAYVLALAIYMFIFIYGVQIMRGVGEEKSSRIMEVMLSSVKPFDLMMGKIVGIAAVGLTQFLLWGVLSFGVSSVVLPMITGKDKPKTEVAATHDRARCRRGRCRRRAANRCRSSFDKGISTVGRAVEPGRPASHSSDAWATCRWAPFCSASSSTSWAATCSTARCSGPWARPWTTRPTPSSSCFRLPCRSF